MIFIMSLISIQGGAQTEDSSPADGKQAVSPNLFQKEPKCSKWPKFRRHSWGQKKSCMRPKTLDQWGEVLDIKGYYGGGALLIYLPTSHFANKLTSVLRGGTFTKQTRVHMTEKKAWKQSLDSLHIWPQSSSPASKGGYTPSNPNLRAEEWFNLILLCEGEHATKTPGAWTTKLD